MPSFYNDLEIRGGSPLVSGEKGEPFSKKANCLKRHERVQRLKDPLRLYEILRALGFYFFQLNIWLPLSQMSFSSFLAPLSTICKKGHKTCCWVLDIMCSEELGGNTGFSRGKLSACFLLISRYFVSATPH